MKRIHYGDHYDKWQLLRPCRTEDGAYGCRIGERRYLYFGLYTAASDRPFDEGPEGRTQEQRRYDPRIRRGRQLYRLLPAEGPHAHKAAYISRLGRTLPKAGQSRTGIEVTVNGWSFPEGSECPYASFCSRSIGAPTQDRRSHIASQRPTRC